MATCPPARPLTKRRSGKKPGVIRICNRMAMESLEQKVRERAERWTRAPYDTETQAAVRALLADGGEALIDAFYMDLEFGTGGLRGLMGPGTNRMNSYTVAMATEGLARFIRKAHGGNDASVPSVAIAYDSRLQSDAFAQVVDRNNV